MVGAGAGGLAQVAVYPLEVIQTRLAATHGVYAGILDAAAKIWRTEGASAFMRCARLAAGGLLVWAPADVHVHMAGWSAPAPAVRLPYAFLFMRGAHFHGLQCLCLITPPCFERCRP